MSEVHESGAIVVWRCEDPPGEATLWTCDEQADLMRADSVAEAIENELEVWDEDRPIPEWMQVHGYAREKVEPYHLGNVLEDVLERIDEDFGDPECYTEPSESMREAEAAFKEAIVAEYRVWICRRVITVNAKVPDDLRRGVPDAA